MSEQQSARFTESFFAQQQWRRRKSFALQGALYGFGAGFLWGFIFIDPIWDLERPLLDLLLSPGLYALAIHVGLLMMVIFVLVAAEVVDARHHHAKNGKILTPFKAAMVCILNGGIYAFLGLGFFFLSYGSLVDKNLLIHGLLTPMVVAPILCTLLPYLIDTRLRRLEKKNQLTADELFYERAWAAGRENQVLLEFEWRDEEARQREHRRWQHIEGGLVGLFFAMVEVGGVLAVFEFVRYCLVRVFASVGRDLSFIPSTTDFFSLDQSIVFFIAIAATAIACTRRAVNQRLKAEAKIEAKIDKLKDKIRELEKYDWG